jgi:cytochrome c peroxidase
LARLIALGVCLISATASAAANYQWSLPRGFPVPFVPADNPMSVAKVELGRRLFFEPRLSATGAYSCASCHEPARAFTDGRALAVGSTGGVAATNAMSLTNVAYNVSFGWRKPNVQSLEEQMREPLFNEHPVEMGLQETGVTALLESDASYRTALTQVFPEAASNIGTSEVIKAIAAFERTLISGNSPFDRYVFRGEHQALSDDAKRGMALFYSARLGCGSCHSGFNFSGAWRDAKGATGEPSFARNGTGSESIRVPTLRNLEVTGPYMHDGRFSTLEAVLDHYQHAADPASTDSGLTDLGLRRFTLTAIERRELLAFLRSLNDPTFTAGFDGERTHSVSGR